MINYFNEKEIQTYIEFYIYAERHPCLSSLLLNNEHCVDCSTCKGRLRRDKFFKVGLYE